MKKLLLPILLIEILIGGALFFYEPSNDSPEYKEDLAYSDFIKKVKAGQIEWVEISNNSIKLKTSTGEEFNTYNPGDHLLINDLLKTDVHIRTVAPEQRSMLMDIFISWFPMLILIVAWFYFMNRMQKNGAGNLGFQKSIRRKSSEYYFCRCSGMRGSQRRC